jgi:hypothetical protein
MIGICMSIRIASKAPGMKASSAACPSSTMVRTTSKGWRMISTTFWLVG